jgi:hypothetical protein
MRPPRVQVTVRGMKILIVFTALSSALVIQSIRVARRDRELAALAQFLADYRQAADRMQWAEQMHKKVYISKAQFDIERASFRKTATSLGLQDRTGVGTYRPARDDAGTWNG